MRLALALLLGLPGQDAAPLPAEPSRYSLVTALFRTRMNAPLPCPADTVCNSEFYHTGYFTDQTALDGPRVPDDVDFKDPPIGWAIPVVAIVEASGGSYRVVAYATAGGEGGMACLSRERLPIGWRPKGAGVVDRGDRICASVADIRLPEPIRVRVLRR